MLKNKMSKFQFTITHKDNLARCGVINTAHGDITTPVFMPVGTKATIKGLTQDMIRELQPDIILANTYHLMIQPGSDIIDKIGGLHKFMNWQKPILTDSGGFQVMSLNSLAKITNEGVKFRSHVDGKLFFLDSKKSMEIQHHLNATITMIFDQCTPYPCEHKKVKQAVWRSNKWAEDSKKHFVERDGYGLFGIMQGGVYDDLRQISAKHLTSLDFDGYAFGGVMGSTQEDMFSVLQNNVELVPEEKPHYLMGVGRPSDIIGAVFRGIDMFDCVLPARNARHGSLFTRKGEIKIKKAIYELDTTPIDEKCECYACKNHTKAYIHHLLKADEMLGMTLMTIHNLKFYLDFMKAIQMHIKTKTLKDFYGQVLANDYGF